MYKVERVQGGWVIVSPYTLGTARRTRLYRDRDTACWVCAKINNYKKKGNK